MYVQDSTLTICTEHSATEVELANLTYPITYIQNDEIKELTIAGGSYIWSGMGYSALGGAALGAITFFIVAEGSSGITQGWAALIGGVLGAAGGALVGGIIGATSYDDIILQDIPQGYDLSILKPLAR